MYCRAVPGIRGNAHGWLAMFPLALAGFCGCHARIVSLSGSWESSRSVSLGDRDDMDGDGAQIWIGLQTEDPHADPTVFAEVGTVTDTTGADAGFASLRIGQFGGMALGHVELMFGFDLGLLMVDSATGGLDWGVGPGLLASIAFGIGESKLIDVNRSRGWGTEETWGRLRIGFFAKANAMLGSEGDRFATGGATAVGIWIGFGDYPIWM